MPIIGDIPEIWQCTNKKCKPCALTKLLPGAGWLERLLAKRIPCGTWGQWQPGKNTIDCLCCGTTIRRDTDA